MSKWVLFLESAAIQDIQGAIEYYESQKPGLGIRFEKAIYKQMERLKNNPFFAIRYDDVRCLPIRKFPFMIHFNIVENRSEIIVRAVFHTKADSSRWVK